ncbi:thiol reductant ABC exporter subunit CydD [Paenibacillus paeoniae]|uniref:Thiol reductant ABC exporter subunit CydD n=1 Tax=Paenibacillus paeoniae TaxID=2292705 RepID=A0A371PKS6_9BACL|nr:thiol reductant ABC exporter subunit CydD [Paenibacillus paeoniae]REK76798.1 thiol reductant ABC exporter subunit CydD [Paenibacillus paeoniae]
MKRKQTLLSELMSEQRRSMIVLTGVSLALGAAIIGQAALLSEAVNRIFVMHADLSSIVFLLGSLLAVMLARALLAYGNGRIGLYMAARAKRTMREKLIRKLANDSVSATAGGQTGGKVSLMLDAVDEGEGYFSQYLPRMIEAAVIPLLMLGVVFAWHYPSGIIMLVTAPFIPIFMVLVGLKTKKKSEEKVEQLSQFAGTFLDSLQGLVTLKLYGRARSQEQEIERSSLAFRDATMGILKIAFTNTFMLELIVMLSIGLVSLELALQLVVFQSMSFHTAFFVLLLVPEFFSLLKNTGTAFHSGRTSMGAMRKVEQLLEERKGEGQTGTERTTVQPGEEGLMLGPMPPNIQLNDVRFQYAPDSFKLYVEKLTIEPGGKIAIVGKSGAGKTTLLHLIAGLLPSDSGDIQLNGRPYEMYKRSSWFEGMSYITQHPYIFSGTLAENIAIGTNRAVNRSEVEQAAASAGLAEMIGGLEKGFDTLVGEGGRGLSGGEKQRLALARAFLNQPAVILFDEPTVGLDVHTEKVLQRSISELAEQATMITVAHRLYTIREADLILYVENGLLLGSGKHDELVECLPAYAEMVHLQRKGRAG